MRRFGLLLGLLLLLATAPGCRFVAGAAILAGEALLEGALDDEDDDCDPPKRKSRPAPRRAQGAPRDPCR